MDWIWTDIPSAACILAGGFFLVAGGIGLLRLPDLFTRMHAAGITDTLGVGLFVLGFVIQAGLGTVAVKLVVLLLFVLLTGPVAVHALAKAALHGGVRPLGAGAGAGGGAAPSPSAPPPPPFGAPPAVEPPWNT